MQQVMGLIDRARDHKLNYKLVLGNTSYGIDKDKHFARIDLFISLNHVDEEVLGQTDAIIVTHKTTINQLRNKIKKRKDATMYGQLSYALHRVAGTQVRNVGSVVGNVVMTKRFQFLSDCVLGLALYDATVAFFHFLSYDDSAYFASTGPTTAASSTNPPHSTKFMAHSGKKPKWKYFEMKIWDFIVGGPKSDILVTSITIPKVNPALNTVRNFYKSAKRY
jgi:hypothetical protein